MKKITIYSTKTCPYCSMLKKWLDGKVVEYTNYNVDINPIAAQQMARVSDGQSGVPFSTIEHDDGSVDKIVGFDKLKFEEVLQSN